MQIATTIPNKDNPISSSQSLRMSSITRELIQKIFGGPIILNFGMGKFQVKQPQRPEDEEPLLQTAASFGSFEEARPTTAQQIESEVPAVDSGLIPVANTAKAVEASESKVSRKGERSLKVKKAMGKVKEYVKKVPLRIHSYYKAS